MIAPARLVAATAASALSVGLAVAGQALLATPASAAEEKPGALLSLDGSSFSAAPDGAIFPNGVLMVPGSADTATIWVKNVSGGPAFLGLALAGATATNAEFLQALTLEAAVEGGAAGAPITLASPDACTPLLAGETLADGETAKVSLRLAMSQTAGNGGQGSSAGADLAVSLTDATAGVALPVDCSAVSTPILAALPAGAVAAGAAAAAGTAASGTTAVAAPAAGGTAAQSDPVATPLAEAAEELGLPTLPFSEHPALYPGVLAAAAVLAAGLVVLILRKRRRSDDSAS
ncbi:hypothetical protein [Naasia sp. SYSU D00057]|uniref:hypothetical protein n=1 Tax=Naasia sp. SYSU D00057 TaxID=2817380 RepID=UPI001B30A720|nr:hypothetical protein [Naasia sp. SYSU D00057]